MHSCDAQNWASSECDSDPGPSLPPPLSLSGCSGGLLSADAPSFSPPWSAQAPETPPEWLHLLSLHCTTSPWPLGKFAMHSCHEQNCSSSVCDMDPGPSFPPPVDGSPGLVDLPFVDASAERGDSTLVVVVPAHPDAISDAMAIAIATHVLTTPLFPSIPQNPGADPIPRRVGSVHRRAGRRAARGEGLD